MTQPPAYPPASFGPSAQQPAPPAVTRKPLSFWLALFFAACTGLAALVILFLFVGIGSMGGMGSSSAQAFQEKVVEGSGRDKIAWISIHGVLIQQEQQGLFAAPDLIESTLQALAQAGEDPQVKAVILDVDSPGGGITESDLIHHAVEKLKKDHGKKVVSLMGNVAASGGYYLSAPADLIMAHPTTVTGSIGVIGQFMNVEELAQKVGVRIETFKSGTHKDLGSMTRPMSEEERRIFQELIDGMYGKFLDVVLAGRGGVSLPDGSAFTQAHLRRIADGRIYTADQALANGLVDRIGYREDAIAQARQLAGLAQARVVEYSRHPSVLDLFSARAGTGGVTIHLPGSGLESASPRLLYLWTTP